MHIPRQNKSMMVMSRRKAEETEALRGKEGGAMTYLFVL